MSWILFKTSLKKSYLWLKEHWQIPFLVVWTVIVYVLTRRNTDALLEVVEAKRDSYKEQVEILRKSHNDEILKRNKLSAKYDRAITLLEEEFKKDKKKLTESQKNDIKEVVIKSKGNSNEIKRKIQEEFGFTLVD
tara:strand:- start:4728 stop:5132 length:405 start_codon:yes stop_codon:yes gene_type:complete